MTLDSVYDYLDSGQVASHPYAASMELLSDLGIFQGSTDGNFYPNNDLWRSEFGTLNERIVESFSVVE